MAPRVFVTRQLPGDALERLRGQVDMDLWEGDGAPPATVLRERCRACEGLLCLLTDRVDAALLDACPNLRVVSSMSVGVDHVEVPALNARRIPLGYTPGVLVETTADLAFALMLAAARRVVESDRFLRAGNWRRWEPDMLLGRDVHGATLGIIGLGAIGQAVARRARGFGMRLVGWSRSGQSREGVEILPLERVLAESDFVSIHVALTDETRNLLDARAIAGMKPGAILVNTARGGIVHEGALHDALASGRLAAAGLDVFETEPVPMDNPLLGLPNVVAAPHIGSASVATRSRMADLSVDNLLAGLAGTPMPHCFNQRFVSTGSRP